MTEFLLTYRRSSGELMACREFVDRAAATRERTSLEARFREDPDVEVIVLTASSREQLERTHSRYFRTMQELLATLGR
jgi:hypothetical protein